MKKMISQICLECFNQRPSEIERCAVGWGNYVYIVKCAGTKYVFRCSIECNAYHNTVYWLEKLSSIDIPVPKVICKGKQKEYEYLILSYLEGKDIGLVYPGLKEEDKRAIAKEIVHIQDQVSALKLENVEPDWSWLTFVALTNMALLHLGYDTDYVRYILEEMKITDVERRAFLFYTLMYCVDFMGERGMQFMDKTVEVDEQIIDRLNGIYDRLWGEWCNKH